MMRKVFLGFVYKFRNNIYSCIGFYFVPLIQKLYHFSKAAPNIQNTFAIKIYLCPHLPKALMCSSLTRPKKRLGIDTIFHKFFLVFFFYFFSNVHIREAKYFKISSSTIIPVSFLTAPQLGAAFTSKI